MENKTMKTTPVEPLVLRFAKAKQELINTVDQIEERYGMPAVLLESLLTETLYRVREQSAREIQTANAVYRKQLSELSDRNKTEKQEDVTHG